MLNCAPLTGPNTRFWDIQKDDVVVGRVTSAVYSPRLKQNIALAMVDINHAVLGTSVSVMTHSGPCEATVVERPFFDPKKSIAAA